MAGHIFPGEIKSRLEFIQKKNLNLLMLILVLTLVISYAPNAIYVNKINQRKYIKDDNILSIKTILCDFRTICLFSCENSLEIGQLIFPFSSRQLKFVAFK